MLKVCRAPLCSSDDKHVVSSVGMNNGLSSPYTFLPFLVDWGVPFVMAVLVTPVMLRRHRGLARRFDGLTAVSEAR